MSSTSSDPYAVLGVAKTATAAEIRSSYKKLVLKFHPDKIQDEAERAKGQDVFQKVQEAYELLSDEVKRAKHDQKARLAELKKDVKTQRDDLKKEYDSRRATYSSTSSSSSPRPSAPSKFEYKNGHLYEEKVPKDYRFFEDDVPFSEEPRSTSRKHDGYEKKSSTKSEDKKKSSSSKYYDYYESWDGKREPAPSSSKERIRIVRESERSSRSGRAKTRDKERRREKTEKYKTAYVEDGSNSDDAYAEMYRAREKRDSRTRSSRTDPGTKPQPIRYEESEYADTSHSAKFEYAREYIQRTRASNTTTVGNSERSRPSSSPYLAYLETAQFLPDRPPMPVAGPPISSGRDRRGSDADKVPLPRSHMSSRRTPPNLVSSNSAPASSFKMSSSTSGRAATASHIREHRETPSTRRSETLPIPNITSRHTEPVIPRPAAYDSGYSSPGTPEMHQGSPPKSSKYMIVDECEDYSRGRRIIIEPKSRHGSTSPPLHETTPTIIPHPAPSRSSRTRPHEPSRTMSDVPILTPRESPKMRSGLGKPVYKEIFPRDDPPIQYTRRFGEEIAFAQPSSRGHRGLFT